MTDPKPSPRLAPDEVLYAWRRSHYAAMTQDGPHPGCPVKALTDAGYVIVPEKVVNALRFYADSGRYEYDETCVWIPPLGTKVRLSGTGGDVLSDDGERARKALALIEASET